MKVVPKDWGTQLWLNDNEQLMVMRAGTQTSLHYHAYHTTELSVLSGEVVVEYPDWHVRAERLNLSSEFAASTTIKPYEEHRVCATVDTIVYEKYVIDIPFPEDDIERLG